MNIASSRRESQQAATPRPPGMDTTKRQGLPTAVILLSAAVMLTGGLLALVAPASFARGTNFPPHEHFVHDLGAFQLAVAATLLLALFWSDPVATALGGLLVLNVVHASNHLADADVGGSAVQSLLLVMLAALAAVALWVRVRRLGLVLGLVASATTPALAPFVRQKTVLLTTYRRDGSAAATPVSIAVEGDHAYLRSFEKAFKTKRLAANPQVLVAPSDARGRPAGPATAGMMVLVHGEQDRHAARLLARKYPALHGVLVPLMHRLGRAKTGHTVHFVLTPADQPATQPARG
jgi:PPOX class probable F420-dependent enzyme